MIRNEGGRCRSYIGGTRAARETWTTVPSARSLESLLAENDGAPWAIVFFRKRSKSIRLGKLAPSGNGGPGKWRTGVFSWSQFSSGAYDLLSFVTEQLSRAGSERSESPSIRGRQYDHHLMGSTSHLSVWLWICSLIPSPHSMCFKDGYYSEKLSSTPKKLTREEIRKQYGE